MSTTDPMVASDVPPPVITRRPWRRRLGLGVGLLGSLLVVFLVVASFVSSGKVGYSPGSADPAEDRIEAIGLTTYESDGDILFLTVKVDRLSWLEYWQAKWFESDTLIVTEREAFGDQTPRQSRQLNQQLMKQAKSTAELVALAYLGYDAYETTGARVLATSEGTPARGVLEPGDVVVAVDGAPVTSRTELVNLLRTTTPGQRITIEVDARNGGERRSVPLALAPRADGLSGGFLGVTIDDRVEGKALPFGLEIDAGKVGGDSAGLAFALAIIDELTPGELTGGNRVAVTGTIALDGRVGEVGGIPQKVAAAKRAKATVMFVPTELADLAKQNAGSMTVIPVATLDEALDALSTLGGNASQAAMSARAAAN